MRPTLEEALQAISDADADTPADAGNANVEAGPEVGSESSGATVADALIAFGRGEAALQNGDWVAYGEAQAELQRILRGTCAILGRRAR